MAVGTQSGDAAGISRLVAAPNADSARQIAALSRLVCAHRSSGFDRVTVPGIVLVRLGSGEQRPTGAGSMGLWLVTFVLMTC